MWSKFLISVAVLYLLAGLAQAKTSIEVDEDGNEYEVKRFFIPGRPMNGGEPTCVIIRGKRSLSTDVRSYGYGNDDENDDTKESFIASPTLALADDSDGDDDFDTDNEKQDDLKDSEQISNSDKKNNIQPPNTELDTTKQEQSLEGFNTSSANMNNEVVFFQFGSPPKVDPLSHAVFELHPVIYDENGVRMKNGFDYSNEDEESVNEDTTTKKPNIRRKIQNPRPNNFMQNRPTKLKKNSQKKQTNSKLKVQNRPVLNHRPFGNNAPNRAPVKSHTTSKNQRHRHPTIAQNTNNNKRQKNQNANNKKIILEVTSQNKRKQKYRGNKKVNGKSESETTTVSFTSPTVGSPDEDNNINCIILNKVARNRRTQTRQPTTTTTTTTTRRPFWRILGRSAGGAEDAGYGKRKHVNLRFFI